MYLKIRASFLVGMFFLLTAGARTWGQSAYNGTAVGSPTYAAGSTGFGQAIVLNGTSQYITLPGGTSGPFGFAANSNFTIVTRFQTSSTAFMMLWGNSTGGAADLWLAVNGGKLTLSALNNANNGGWTVGTHTVSDGAWHNAALVMNGATATVYLDGVSELAFTGSGGYLGTPAGTVSAIGCFNNNGLYFLGNIDETAVYTVASTAAGIINPTAPVANSAASLQALYHFDNNVINSAGLTGAISTPAPTFSALSSSSVTVASAPSGGTSPYSIQFQRAPDNAGSPGTWANVGTAGTATTYTDSTVAAGTTYWYRYLVTDSAATPNTATSSAATVSTSTTVTLTLTNAYFSAYGWDNTTGHVAVSPGNYFKTSVTNSVASAFYLNVASTNDSYVEWTLDAGPLQSSYLTSSVVTGGKLTLTGSLAVGTHTLQVWYRSTSPFVNKWTGSNVVNLSGLTITSGTLTCAAPATYSKSILFYGDSITEGEGTETNVSNGYAANSDYLHSWSSQVADAMGCEYSVAAFGGQSWPAANNAADGATPGLIGSWNFIRSGVSRSFATPPTYEIMNMGTNGNTLGAAGAVSAWLTNVRAAVGVNCKIALLIPFGGFVLTTTPSLPSEFAAYQGSVTQTTTDGITVYKGTFDANTVLINLGSAALYGLGNGYSLSTYDGTHPSQYGASREAALVVRGLNLAFGGTTTTTISGTKRRVQ